MGLLDREIEYQGRKTSIRNIFKYALKEALVNDPPKRLLGDSNWLWELARSLVLADILKGDKDVQEDGYIDVDFEWSNFDGLIKTLIDKI